jgi:hypothetical protein
VAKQQPHKGITENPKVFVKGEHKLVLAETFVFDVEIYRMTPTSYSLEDSRRLSGKEGQIESINYLYKDNVMFKNVTTMVGATKKWLQDKKYVELCQEPTK